MESNTLPTCLKIWNGENDTYGFTVEGNEIRKEEGLDSRRDSTNPEFLTNQFDEVEKYNLDPFKASFNELMQVRYELKCLLLSLDENICKTIHCERLPNNATSSDNSKQEEKQNEKKTLLNIKKLSSHLNDAEKMLNVGREEFKKLRMQQKEMLSGYGTLRKNVKLRKVEDGLISLQDECVVDFSLSTNGKPTESLLIPITVNHTNGRLMFPKHPVRRLMKGLKLTIRDVTDVKKVLGTSVLKVKRQENVLVVESFEEYFADAICRNVLLTFLGGNESVLPYSAMIDEKRMMHLEEWTPIENEEENGGPKTISIPASFPNISNELDETCKTLLTSILEQIFNSN